MLFSFYQHPAGHGFAHHDQIEQRFQPCVSISSSIETEYEFVEAGLQVLYPQTMIDADLPRFVVGEFEVGENVVNPRKHVMGRFFHRPDDHALSHVASATANRAISGAVTDRGFVNFNQP